MRLSNYRVSLVKFIFKGKVQSSQRLKTFALKALLADRVSQIHVLKNIFKDVQRSFQEHFLALFIFNCPTSQDEDRSVSRNARFQSITEHAEMDEVT